MTQLASTIDEIGIRRIAAGTLGLVMAAHTLLETGVDALFLGNVAIERLPLLTIAIALLALAIAQVPSDRGHRGMLLILQLSAAFGTLGFWVLASPQAVWAYYLLYIWSGTVTSVVVVRFWLLLGEFFTITQGKRLFASIAMGGSLGALAGSLAAAFFAPRVGAEGLLVLSAAAFGVSAIGPLLLLRMPARAARAVRDSGLAEATGLAASARGVLGNPYACRIAVLVMLAGMTLTLGDYLFKSVLTEEVARGDLATVLSRVYLALNVLSISMLAIGVTPLVQRLGVDRSLVVLPSLLGLAAAGVLLGSGFIATIFLKTVDGTLRYSLHKTATELLYLPMTSRLRSLVKGAIDIVGQTAAKSLASVLLLGLVTLGWTRMGIAAAVVVFAGAWIFAAFSLRRAYLDVFRETLSEGAIETEIDVPELDLDSARSLIQALNSPEERRVRASMNILAISGHADLIPSLILYHPSPEVVIDALQLFATTEREDLESLLTHLLEHADANVRAASVRASFVLDPERPELESLAESECLAIRVSAETGLMAMGRGSSDRYRALMDEVIAYDEADPKRAAVHAAELHYDPAMREALLSFAEHADPELAVQAVRAMRASEDAWFTDPLVGLLGDRRIRDEVRSALIERGPSALAVLSVALVDSHTPLPVQRHIPRTIARFGTQDAAMLLVDSLSKVERGMVRFKILRGLEALLLGRGAGETERVVLGESCRDKILDEFDRTLERTLDLYEKERVIAAVQVAEPERATLGGELLTELLVGKRDLAAQRLFSMLGLLYPEEDFRAIREGAESEDENERASAGELIETLLPRKAADGLLHLFSAASGDAELNYETAVQRLMADHSVSVRAVALYHAGELGVHEGTGAGSAGSGESDAADDSLQERALALLRDLSEGSARAVGPVARILTVR